MFSLEGAALAGRRPSGAAAIDAAELTDGKAAEQIPLIAAGEEAESGGMTFDLADGPPIYRSDMLVRRADALQATKIGREAEAAFFNPDDLRELGIAPGDRVLLSRRAADGSGGGVEWEFPAFADSRLARGAALAWPEAGGIGGGRASDFSAAPVLARAEAV